MPLVLEKLTLLLLVIRYGLLLQIVRCCLFAGRGFLAENCTKERLSHLQNSPVCYEDAFVI